MKTDQNPLTIQETYVPIISIYADGSCLRNGTPDSSSGAGAVLIDRYRNEMRLQSSYLGPGTNQRAEIAACTNAIKLLKRPCRIEIVSDSLYVVDTMAGKNRIKSNHGLWDELVRSCYRHHVTWKWVRGHSGEVFQEIADRLSRAAAEARRSLAEEELNSLSSLLDVNSNHGALSDIERHIRRILTDYKRSESGRDLGVENYIPTEFAYAPPSAF